MSWRDFLNDEQRVVLPWTGGRTLQLGARTWRIQGSLPEAHGWAQFTVSARAAIYNAPAEPGALQHCLTGFLAGDRLIPEDAAPQGDLLKTAQTWPRVYLLVPGERFRRVVAGRTTQDGPLIYSSPAFPVGVEDAVQRAFEDDQPDLTGIAGVPLALSVAYAFAQQLRALQAQQRLAAERRRREQEQRRVAEARLGSAMGRRETARTNFAAAAQAALALSGARYLDHRRTQPNEYVVRFHWLNRRFECVVDERLQVIDSGVCLTAEYRDQDFVRGTRGDVWLTLESLPGVLQQADREDRLVVYRH